jgi:tRNA nucleotidyltransferase (CCA-adding enzyme)
VYRILPTIELTRVISEDDKALVRELKKVVREFVPTAEVLLYGSVARGIEFKVRSRTTTSWF